ncbi:hypothetical protein EJ06DRAFT_79774 [Trichodelitschia bisporula]|uniref:Uncharacterized protein n=1 Tax=Trichodelitschia bisporula TaxID=703511 RepID=A0A6G1HTX8_9PEZI|nr:hypothetical protein EJ06DRAFT_79774 [Trichodelitschia bisporula]
MHYSPGICPSGYAIGDTSILSTLNRAASQTQAFCCPTGYAVDSGPIDPSNSGSLCISCLNWPATTRGPVPTKPLYRIEADLHLRRGIPSPSHVTVSERYSSCDLRDVPRIHPLGNNRHSRHGMTLHCDTPKEHHAQNHAQQDPESTPRVRSCKIRARRAVRGSGGEPRS